MRARGRSHRKSAGGGGGGGLTTRYPIKSGDTKLQAELKKQRTRNTGSAILGTCCIHQVDVLPVSVFVGKPGSTQLVIKGMYRLWGQKNANTLNTHQNLEMTQKLQCGAPMHRIHFRAFSDVRARGKSHWKSPGGGGGGLATSNAQKGGDAKIDGAPEE